MRLRDAIRSAVTETSGKPASPASEDDELDDDDDLDEPSAAAQKVGDAQKAKPDAAQPKDAVTAAGEQLAKKSAPPSEVPKGPLDPAKAGLLEAPARWKPQERADFQKLPDDAKRILLAREERFNTAYVQRTQELAQTRQHLEGITSAFTPTYRSQMQAAGIRNEREAIDYLVKFHDLYESNPVGYVRAAMQAKGLTAQQVFPELAQAQQHPSTVPGAAQGDDQTEWVDPAWLKHTSDIRQAFTQELEPLKRTVAEITQAQRDYNARAAEAAAQQRRDTLASLEEVAVAFATDTAEDGTPRYPHFEQVFDTMCHLMSTNPKLMAMPLTMAPQKLEEAYEMAVRLSPDLYSQAIEQARTNALAEHRRELQAKAAADEAARAQRAQTVQPSPGSHGGRVGNGRMRIRDAAKAGVQASY